MPQFVDLKAGIVATVTNDEALKWTGEQEWSDDEQFSEKRTTSVYDLMGERERFANENAELKEDVGRFKGILGTKEAVWIRQVL